MAAARSLTESVVLALLVESPSHGFALARELRPAGDLGRILTVRRPLVYRALDRLVESGQARAVATEQGEAGPTRTVHRSTSAGTRAVNRWLAEPVVHVRDLRVEFLIKLRLRERRGLDLVPLIDGQRSALGERLAHLTGGIPDGGSDADADPSSDPDADPKPDSDSDPESDVVDRWRYHNARAVLSFLDDLASMHAGPDRST